MPNPNPDLGELATTTTDNYRGRTADNVRKGGRAMAELTVKSRHSEARKRKKASGKKLDDALAKALG